MMEQSRQHVIDIDKLSASTRKKLENLRPMSTECCIYRVPDRLRRLNELKYTPQVLSIGPIHYRRKNLRAMEDHKIRYLEDFLQLCQVSLEECFELIQKSEMRLRNSYADIIELSSENFMKMVLVDAAFLVMILLCDYFNSLARNTDRLFQKPKMLHDIRYDLILLENQLPFFILEDLFKLSKIQVVLEKSFDLSQQPYDFKEETTMIILAYKFIRNWNMLYIPERRLPSKAEHLLDLLRTCSKPANWYPQRNPAKTLNMPSIRELHQAGVRFQVGSEENMFDVKFKNGVLEIPPLSIDDYTELVFRNLQAYELCHCLDSLFRDYFCLMRRLTIAPADVEVLSQKGIVHILVANAERVSNLFHCLSPGNIISLPEFLYADIINGLNEYYDIDWHRWKATWVHNYFKAPWAIFSFTAALFLLVLTVVQTVCSILQLT